MRKLILLLALLTPLTANAVTLVTRYVNTACSTEGDGTVSTCTGGAAGSAGAHKTLASALTGTYGITATMSSGNLVTADKAVTIDCRGSTADTTNAVTTGITTDATRTLTITSSAGNRHSGTWSTSKYRLSISTNLDGGGALLVNTAYLTVSWLQIEKTVTGAPAGTATFGILFDKASGTAGKWVVDQTILRYTGDYTNQTVTAIRDFVSGVTGVTKIFRNNIIYDWGINSLELRTAANDLIYAYNNTVLSNYSGGNGIVVRGYGGATSALIVKNNVVQGGVTNWDMDPDAATWTHNNNISEDATSPDTSYRSKAVVFIDETARNLHLYTGDTEAKNTGTDLSAATQGFSIDIENDTRPDSTLWDIGADEETGGTTTTSTTSTTLPPGSTIFLDHDW